MRKYLFCEAGFIEKPNWLPNCWVNVECPTPDDFDFLEKELNVPAAFYTILPTPTNVPVSIRKEIGC